MAAARPSHAAMRADRAPGTGWDDAGDRQPRRGHLGDRSTRPYRGRMRPGAERCRLSGRAAEEEAGTATRPWRRASAVALASAWTQLATAARAQAQMPGAGRRQAGMTAQHRRRAVLRPDAQAQPRDGPSPGTRGTPETPGTGSTRPDAPAPAGQAASPRNSGGGDAALWTGRRDRHRTRQTGMRELRRGSADLDRSSDGSYPPPALGSSAATTAAQPDQTVAVWRPAWRPAPRRLAQSKGGMRASGRARLALR